MKILIITYSREVNPGTFLQAYGVQHAFSKMFPQAEIHLLKHKRAYTFAGNVSKQEKKGWQFFKGKMTAVPRRLKYEYHYKKDFKLTEEEFGFFDYNKEEFKAFAEGYDLIVVGSDTILINLKKDGQYGLMWLNDINTDKVMFAASAAPAKYDLDEQDEKFITDTLNDYAMIGVRDSVTHKLFVDRVGYDKDKVYLQLDPTYLIPESCFSLSGSLVRKLSKIKKQKKVVLVNFGSGYWEKEALTRYLQKNSCYVVSTVFNEFADENLMTFSPFEWAALFKYVDITVTERFHDSVFTLRNEHPVIAIDWDEKRFAIDGSSKTGDLLSVYNLDEYHFTKDNKESEIYFAIDALIKTSDIPSIKASNATIYADYALLMDRIAAKFNSKGIECQVYGG